ncbi:MAG TPA: hypothetical protein VJU82_13185, partial [Acidobacteriaceae bacterium]|nr:hypothetical protein [Acidobacteriaceae bacterium]
MMRTILLLLSVTFGVSAAALAQAPATESLGSSCTLENHVYRCDGAGFAKALASAKSAAVEAQNVDAHARDQLKKMIAGKYGKQVVEQGGGSPDLIFLIIPVGVDGINISPGEPTLGSLRVYSAKPEGGRDHLLWAETHNGPQ